MITSRSENLMILFSSTSKDPLLEQQDAGDSSKVWLTQLSSSAAGEIMLSSTTLFFLFLGEVVAAPLATAAEVRVLFLT